MDAGQLMDSLVAGLQPLVDIADGGDWREQPVPFLEFVTSPAHLGLPPLYPLQAEAVQALLGDDPCAIFADPDQAVGRTYQAAVLLWGKGSGKDYLCSIVTCYLIYTLLCLRDPQSYLQLGPGEPIDLVNVDPRNRKGLIWNGTNEPRTNPARLDRLVRTARPRRGSQQGHRSRAGGRAFAFPRIPSSAARRARCHR